MVPRPLSVRSKLALLFFSACALTFGVGGAFISRSVSSTLEQEILTRLEYQSRAYATALDAHLSMLARRTEDFASDGFVRDAGERLLAQAPGSGPETKEALGLRSHLLRNKLPLVNDFSDLWIVSADGAILLAAHEDPPPSLMRWLASSTALDRALVSDFFVPSAGEAVARLAIAAPLTSREGGRRLGWLVASVNPNAWIFGALGASGLGTQASLGELGRVHLIDARGARLTLLGELFREGLPSATSEHVQSGFGIVHRRPAEARERSPLQAPESDLLLSSFPLLSAPMRLEVELSTGEALDTLAGLQGRNFGIGIVVAIAACLVFLLPMGLLMRPLLRLAEAARRIGNGELPPPVCVDSKDEIGEVGRSFVAMAQAVEERTRLQERSAADLRRRQGELQAERDRLNAVIGSMAGGLIVLDPSGHPVVFNQAAEPVLRALQDREHGIESRHLCERGALGSAACHACLFDPLRAPKSCQVEIGSRTYEIHASKLPPDVDGKVGRVLVCHDFSDRVNLDDRLIHQERLAVLGEVAAVMAHELNNPLAAISMYNQMLGCEVQDSPSLVENVDVIQRNVESCKRAVRELLDYATGATPEVDAIDVGAVLEDVAIFTRPLRERAEVKLEIQCPSAPLEAWGDELQVRQIFVNLMVNAIQALAPRGGTVRMRASAEGQHVVVTIEDDGPGIPAEVQGEIFRPFFTTKDRGQGTGLGLSTARRIAEMHGGGLELVRTGETGTVFRVRLMQHEPTLAGTK